MRKTKYGRCASCGRPVKLGRAYTCSAKCSEDIVWYFMSSMGNNRCPRCSAWALHEDVSEESCSHCLIESKL